MLDTVGQRLERRAVFREDEIAVRDEHHVALGESLDRVEGGLGGDDLVGGVRLVDAEDPFQLQPYRLSPIPSVQERQPLLHALRKICWDLEERPGEVRLQSVAHPPKHGVSSSHSQPPNPNRNRLAKV